MKHPPQLDVDIYVSWPAGLAFGSPGLAFGSPEPPKIVYQRKYREPACNAVLTGMARIVGIAAHAGGMGNAWITSTPAYEIHAPKLCYRILHRSHRTALRNPAKPCNLPVEEGPWMRWMRSQEVI